MSDTAHAEPLWPGFAAARSLDVLGIGQNSLDRVVLVDGPPPDPAAPDPPDALELPGGQVATALLACALLGLRCAYVGAVGDDAAARSVLAPLRRAGVDVGGVRAIPGARTRSARICVERGSGERHVAPRRDPALRLSPDAVDPARIAAARVLHLDAEHPRAALRAARLARAAGTAVLLDLDRPGPGVLELLDLADFPIVSEAFADWISGGVSVSAGLGRLAARGPRLAVVTLGPAGALARGPREADAIRSEGFRVEPRDTTGAGDVFHAAFAFGLLQGWGRARVLRTANAAAALSCRALGAQGGLPSRAELERFLAADAARDGGGR